MIFKKENLIQSLIPEFGYRTFDVAIKIVIDTSFFQSSLPISVDAAFEYYFQIFTMEDLIETLFDRPKDIPFLGIFLAGCILVIIAILIDLWAGVHPKLFIDL